METILLTIYVLVWPVIVLGVFGVIVRAFAKEARQARRQGRRMI